MAALGVADARQGMDARALQMDATRQDMRQQAAAWAATLDEQQRLVARRGIEETATRMMGATTPEAWDSLMTELGKPELVGQFGQRDALIMQSVPYAEALAMYANQNAPREQSFIVSGPNDYGLPPQGTYNVTVGPGGVTADPIGSIPAPDNPSATQEKINLLQTITNPNTGANFTAQEATEITLLYEVSRDPFSNQVQLINKATGQVIGMPATPAPVAAPAAPPPATVPPPATAPAATAAPAAPPPAFNIANDNARDAFGIPGALRNLANRGMDAAGMQMPFPDIAQDVSNFAVLGETLLNDIQGAYGRQPPSWLLQQINELIPRAGQPFTGPDNALMKFESLRASMEQEITAQRNAFASAPSPEIQAQVQARVGALETALFRIEDAIAQLSPQSPQISQEDADFLRSLGLDP
jgi:hypothetical protein